jgi:hypothetical protein
VNSRDDFIRRLKLRDFFEDKATKFDNKKDRRFVEKSTFVPPDRKLKAKTIGVVEEIMRLTDNVLDKYTVKDGVVRLNTANNLSREEFESIQKLKNNEDIVIKPADKGGATVILNRESYLKEAYRQMNDTKYYVRLDKPRYHDTALKIKDILANLNQTNFITDEQLDFLSGPHDYKPRNIYFLPKIHKEQSKWPWPDMPEARPICSDIQSETHRISTYIDSFLNPLACGHDSFIKNSFDFVKRIRNTKFDENWLLVTGDVSALYTNMHHDRTIEGVKKIFELNPDSSRPDEDIVRLLNLILKNNDFTFNNETFLQILGTAMGKVFSPSLANIYLLEFDDRAMNGYPIKPLLFLRYLDDIFMIWPGNITQLKEYELFLNNLIPDIKINFEVSNSQISFLDVLIYVEGGRLQTRTFFKQTDTHQLLHTGSFHPKHTTQGIIKSQLIRFKRLSSSAQDYNKTCKILFGFLGKRGYNLSEMRKTQYNIWFHYKDRYCDTEANNDKDNNSIGNNNSQENSNGQENSNNTFNNNNEIILATADKDSKDLLPIIVDFCSVGNELAKNYKNLVYNKIGRDKFSIVTAYKNSRNLRQMLIRSKFVNKSSGAFTGCVQSKCLTCRFHAEPKKQIKSSNNDRIITIKNNISCNTINIIYIITCRKCKQQYVGETGRSLRERVNDHRSAIKNKSDTPIGIHFNMREHSRADLAITPIEIIENVFMRRNKEKALQKFLKTIHPEGINNLPSNQ